MTGVIWHDLECGAYRADLTFWLSVAEQYEGPILDVGAGTGRVALELARAGHEVIALDSDAELLAELERRAAADRLPLRTLCADARQFHLDAPVGACLVPMQTVQLLGGGRGRVAFLDCARRQLLPGGVIAMAITEELETFELHDGGPAPLPDLIERDGTLYCSQPTAIRVTADHVVLERRRETVDPHGTRQVSENRINLDRITPDQLQHEGEQLGLRALPLQSIAQTEDHVGSRVVMLTA